MKTHLSYATLLAFFLLIANQLNSQTSGDSTRKTLITVFEGGMPANSKNWDHPLNYSGRPGFYVNHTEGVTFEHIVGKNGTIGLVFETFSAGSRNQKYYTNSIYASTLGDWRTRAYTGGILAKFFPIRITKTIAPQGPYFRFDFLAVGTNTKFTSNDLKYQAVSIEKYIYFAYGFGIGNSFLLRQRFLIDMGIRLRLSGFHGISTIDTNRGIVQAYYEEANMIQLRRSDRVKIYVGFGYLF
jgi:hypothetical protein